MLTATKDVKLPTTITGSLPRPLWYTENLGHRSFMEAMINARYREQYTDAVSCYLRDQEMAGLDIVTDGDARFDTEVGGYSWFSYPLMRLAGIDYAGAYGRPTLMGRVPFARGHILHEGLEARLQPVIAGPIGRGKLQYSALYLTAQALTKRPVKFGTITAELLGLALKDNHYKSRRERIIAIADALHDELETVVAAGCTVIQLEEPQLHLAPLRGAIDQELTLDFLVEVFNRTVRGLRDKCEVWGHSCWGNPSQQRMFASNQSYKSSLGHYNNCDADVLTFETCTSGGMDLEAIGKEISGKKIAIGVIDHHTLQVETPEEVAGMIRKALKWIGPERLVISSDCGMGREGMSRKHAFFKMVSLVQGTNIVRRELGLPEAECRAADPRFSLTQQG
ncbi:MAG TPA: cobalamin-independent methionine synthase II family protein [Stellaceae bacterium]|nr:cobalamin-independent methionine synthase II family protein [Stellaceae bacterium]